MLHIYEVFHSEICLPNIKYYDIQPYFFLLHHRKNIPFVMRIYSYIYSWQNSFFFSMWYLLVILCLDLSSAGTKMAKRSSRVGFMTWHLLEYDEWSLSPSLWSGYTFPHGYHKKFKKDKWHTTPGKANPPFSILLDAHICHANINTFQDVSCHAGFDCKINMAFFVRHGISEDVFI